MLAQLDPAEMAALMTGTVLLVFLVVFIIIFIVALMVYRWSIEKYGGQVESLGAVFVTLLIAAIVSLIVNSILGFFMDGFMGLIVTTIVSFVIQSYFVSKRHYMEMGPAATAVLVAYVSIIALTVVAVIVIMVIFLGGIMLL